MLRSLVFQGNGSRAALWRSVAGARRLTTQVRQQDEPLRILFCGSESFSIAALEALQSYKDEPKSNILSIDVATRKDKLGGRGMKETRSPPIKSTAAQLGLRLHQFDTFTGWYLPEYPGTSQPYINLVVAVSFGLLVPPRILKSARFGGLNIHPSMLPEFRGAAPINWTIVKGHTHTGVSLQTLHPSKFDHGTILDQTPEPGIAIPDPTSTTAHELRHFLASVGADMLVNAVRNKLYLQPYPEISTKRSSSLAPKIVTSMKTFDPFNDDMTTILRKVRGIPRLWADATCTATGKETTKRIILGVNIKPGRLEGLPAQDIQDVVDHIPIGTPFAVLESKADISQSQEPILVKVKGESFLTIPDLLTAGAREGPAAAAAARARLFAEPVVHGALAVYKFHRPLAMPETQA